MNWQSHQQATGKKVIVVFQTKLFVYHSDHLTVTVKKHSSNVFNHFQPLATFIQTQQVHVLITVCYIYSTCSFSPILIEPF